MVTPKISGVPKNAVACDGNRTKILGHLRKEKMGSGCKKEILFFAGNKNL